MKVSGGILHAACQSGERGASPHAKLLGLMFIDVH